MVKNTVIGVTPGDGTFSYSASRRQCDVRHVVSEVAPSDCVAP